MLKIKIMDEILANKIAAGEVVERCASVVKELVENSIDAGSSEIKVELIDSGTKLIRVTDDGEGMEKEDAILAFGRHATSKITSEDDLFCIQTLGFRGEALAAISSVSEIYLKTSQGTLGTIVELTGGKIVNIATGDARKGTIIEVKNLFYNTPARLKHMKSLYTELASITDYINKLALSHTNIRFTLINNENTILKTDGSSLLKTIGNIYGINVVKNMFEVVGENDDYEISGYISNPSIHKSTRNHITIIVNGRVVRNADLNRVINEAYHSYKPDNRYPIIVLNVEVDPSLTDVNIHPTKMDIKFSKFEELSELVTTIIVRSLDKKTLIDEVNVSDKIQNPIPEEKENLDNDEKIDLFNQQLNEVLEKQIKYEEQTLDLERVVISKENVLLEEKDKYEVKQRLPELEPIGVVHGTYIICQNKEGMYLIDQHAAKERVNYEIFLNKLSNPSNKMIEMLVPLTFEFSTNEFIIIKENLDLLTGMGFDVSEFGYNSLVIKAHPVWLTIGFVDLQIKKIIEAVIIKEKKFSLEKFNDNLAHDLACKASIKGNTIVSIDEMESLINDLRKCNNPFNCPHGRPVLIVYSVQDLEKLFKRSGFDSTK